MSLLAKNSPAHSPLRSGVILIRCLWPSVLSHSHLMTMNDEFNLAASVSKALILLNNLALPYLHYDP